MSEINIEKGDIIICVLAGDYGKPRPGVVIQSNKYNKNRSSVLICPLTTHLTDDSDARMLLIPTKLNGLVSESQIMIDKGGAIKKEKIQKKIGKLSLEQIQELTKAIKAFID